MPFYNQFDVFDPIKGYVPEHPISQLSGIAGRARSILKGKSLEKLRAAAERINMEIERYFDDEKYMAVSDLRDKLRSEGIPMERYFYWEGNFQGDGNWLIKEHVLDDLGVATESNCSEVDALKVIIENRDSNYFLPEGAPEPEIEEYPEGKSYELFAVLALWLVVDALELTKCSISIASCAAINAMEAVCYAEHLKEINWLEFYQKSRSNDELAKALLNQKYELGRQEKKERTERIKQLNKHRHAETNRLKELVTTEWATSPAKFPSAEKAGIYYSQWLASQAPSKSFEPRTVTGWIRAYAKEKGIKFR